MHKIDKSQAKVGKMIIKIDLEKAYDSIEWSFIKMILQFFNFPPSFINLIMTLISSISYRILFNGGKLDLFIHLKD